MPGALYFFALLFKGYERVIILTQSGRIADISTGSKLSLVTLNRYLLGRRPEGENNTLEAAPAENYLDLASRTIAALRRSVLCGETFADLFEEAEAIRKDLCVEQGHEIVNQCATRMEDLLSSYQVRLRQAESDRAADFRNVLDMLNETLSYFTDDNQKTSERRKQLETNLTKAARMNDISSLRSYLTRMVQSVRDEGRRDQDKAQEVIDLLGRHIQQVHKAQSKFNSDLPGRTKAIEYLKQMREANPHPSRLHIALFVADSLGAIRERHGEEAAKVILQELGRKQLKQLTLEGQVFHWSANALALIWQHADESSSASDIAAKLKMPCEQRVFVGTRVAIFNVILRSLVVQVRDSNEEIEGTLDRFNRRGMPC